MSIETLISVLSFAISIGGFVAIFVVENRKKEIIFVVIISVLVVTSGIALYQHISYRQYIARVEKEIITKLANNTWTFNQIYEEVLYKQFSVVNEALFNAVQKGKIGHTLMEFRSHENLLLQVRGYYVN